MPVLLTVYSETWKLEVVGKIPILPPFLSSERETRVHIIGEASGLIWDPVDGERQFIGTGPVRPVLFENTEYEIYFTTYLSDSDLVLPRSATLHHKAGPLRHYRLNFRNDVGYSEFAVSTQSKVTIRFEVFPIKIDYRADYRQMRDEIASFLRNLAFSVLTRTFSQAEPFPTASPTLSEWISLIETYFQKFEAAARAITLSPHTRVIPTSKMVKPDRARKTSPVALRNILKKLPRSSEKTVRDTAIPIPRCIPEQSSRLSFDTDENRYFKAVILATMKNLEHIIRAASSGDEDADLTAEQHFFYSLRPHALNMLKRLQRLLSSSFLKEVGHARDIMPNSLIMHMHPKYAAFSQLARILNGGLTLAGGPLRIGIKNIAELYEYWCFLRLAALLGSSLELSQQSVVRTTHRGIVIVLTKGRQSAVEFVDRRTGRTIYLTYNRRFENLPTFRQMPDNVIRLTSDFDLFIFDAKYRMDFDPSYQDVFGGIGPTVDDIETLHRYRDAIVARADGSVEYVRIVRGGVILFPFHSEADYVRHRFYRSIRDIGIGGLPFLPCATKLVEDEIRQLLEDQEILPGS